MKTRLYGSGWTTYSIPFALLLLINDKALHLRVQNSVLRAWGLLGPVQTLPLGFRVENLQFWL